MEYLVNWFSMLFALLQRFFNIVINFFSSILNFFTSLWSILSTLWYGAKTMFSKVIELVNDLFSWSLLGYVSSTFNDLVFYLWIKRTLFFSTLFVVILVRIWIAFVFKVLRLNMDYKN